MTKQRKQVRVSLNKILKSIEMMEGLKDYEITEEILSKLAAMLDHKLMDSEIEDFANWYFSNEASDLGFDKEHYDSAKEILEKFRENYCN